jgi:Tfp pilus assembly protein PilO
MRTRETFREHPSVIPTRTSRPWAWQVLGTLAVVGVIGFSFWLDDADRMRSAQAAQQRQNELRNQWEQGRQVGHQEAAQMQLAQMREAFQAGLDEGRERCTVARP